ncbi:MAG: site-specific integrase, partial [Bacteroidota bacterium]
MGPAWKIAIKGFTSYLRLERSLSANTLSAYIHDVENLAAYLDYQQEKTTPEHIKHEQLQGFIRWVSELGMTARTQARVLSGIK